MKRTKKNLASIHKLKLFFLWCNSPAFWLLVCIPLMGGCSWFFDAEKEGLEELTPDLPTLPYKTVIKPQTLQDAVPEVEAHLKSLSLLVQLESRPPPSLNALYHRSQNDIARLKGALAEKGYFDGETDFIIDKKTTPVTVTLTFSIGKQYEISAISVLAAEHVTDPFQIAPSKTEKAVLVRVGDKADLGRIEDSNRRLAKTLRDHGYPYGEMDEPQGEIDRQAKTLNVIFRAIPGQKAVYGKTDITGLENLDAQFVRNRLVWQEGKPYDERDLEETRRKLMGTGLFSSIDIDLQDNDPVKPDAVPLAVKLSEGPPRTIGAGVKYATIEGIGVQAFWSHKNIFGGGEGLGASLRLSPLLSRAKIDLDIPDVFAPEQHLRQEISITQERNRAYRSRSTEAGVRLEHPFSDTVKGSVGLTAETGHVDRAGVSYLNRLVGLPLSIQYDGSNDLIDPSKGARLAAQVTPYRGKSGNDHQLAIATARGSYYLRLLKGDRAVIAGWAHGGTIATKSFDSLAPNKRFYAGGAGSVRAYGYKLLGPLDGNRVPLGGKSLLEYGVEGRFKVTDTIGFVVFAEAGSLSATAAPDISNQARLGGVGAGLRYYTPIGPLRLDVATPVKRRRYPGGKPIDSAYQFYVSLGQAF